MAGLAMPAEALDFGGYPVGYYSSGSWGYAPGYALGNYGYGRSFGTNPEYPTMPGGGSGYYRPGYAPGYGGRAAIACRPITLAAAAM